MMTIRIPEAADIPALKSLWQEAFVDPDEFIDSFMERVFSPERAMCAVYDGELASALYWFDCECEGARFAYLYAIATRSKHRRRGLCRELIKHTHERLRELGFSGALLVPENERLAAYYAGLGYIPCTGTDEFDVAAADHAVPIRRLTADEYANVRRSLLPRGGVVQEGESLAMLRLTDELFAADGVILAANRDTDTLTASEILGNISLAPMLLCALECKRGHFRTIGEGHARSMLYPLRDDITPPKYFGLAFD